MLRNVRPQRWCCMRLFLALVGLHVQLVAFLDCQLTAMRFRNTVRGSGFALHRSISTEYM